MVLRFGAAARRFALPLRASLGLRQHATILLHVIIINILYIVVVNLSEITVEWKVACNVLYPI